MAYKINFTDQEKNLFNKYEGDYRRNKLMSLYSFLLKYQNNGELRISYTKLHKVYNVAHSYKMALTTIKDAIETLIDLGLIKVVKVVRKVNTYSFVRFFHELTPTDNSTDNSTNENNNESIENTSSTAYEDLDKYINGKTIDNDIDSNNNSNTNIEFETLEKVKNKGIVINRAKELLKELKVKSSWIKKAVLDKLSKYYSNITIKYLDSYICKVIMQIRAISVTNFNNLVLSKKNKKTLRFNDYEQREYDYDLLEKQLLGIDSYDETVLTNAEESTYSNNRVVDDILSALA